MEAERCPFCAGEIPPGVMHDWKSCAMRVNDHRYQIRDRMMQMQADRDEALALLAEIKDEAYVVTVSAAERLDALLKRVRAAGAGEEREER